MKTFKNFIAEGVRPQDLVAVAGRGKGQLDITKHIRKTLKISGKGMDDVYFDGGSLVYGDKTVVRNALNNKKLTVNDLVDAVRKKMKPANPMSKLTKKQRQALASPAARAKPKSQVSLAKMPSWLKAGKGY
tara:strand:- start:96 stop:488 length:393 start_codon:yes stop_codon:yes gene_type:complete